MHNAISKLLASIAIVSVAVAGRAYAQSPDAPDVCIKTSQTIELVRPEAGEFWFRTGGKGIYVYLPPDEVVRVLRSSTTERSTDAMLARDFYDFLDPLLSQLPLETHTDVRDVAPGELYWLLRSLHSRFLQTGRAAVEVEGVGFVDSVHMEQERGPACNIGGRDVSFLGPITRKIYWVGEDDTRLLISSSTGNSSFGDF